MKPGIKTTEFWSTLLVSISAIAAAVFGIGDFELDPEVAGTIAAGGVALYAASRAWVKAAESRWGS